MSRQPKRAPKRLGVYFLANDRVYDLTVAFLNSFRLSNPEIELCMIPYDANSKRVIGLRHSYDFSLLDDEDLFRNCDNVGKLFHNQVVGQYRKLAAWAGIFDEFIYIDVDTLVLKNVDFCFQFLPEYDFVLSHSNIETIRRWVWKESIFASGELLDDQINFAANTGFIISRKGALCRSQIASAAEKALKLAPHMELLCAEQPFLNYLIVTSGRPYTSLHVLKHKGGLNLPEEIWAGTPGGVVNAGQVWFGNGREPLLLHWAGEWQPRGSGQIINSDMPYRNFWVHYRHLRKELR